MNSLDRRRLVSASFGLVLLPLTKFAVGQALAKKRVVRATIPFADPDAPRIIRKGWAEYLAPHGFTDGENIEIEPREFWTAINMRTARGLGIDSREHPAGRPCRTSRSRLAC